jgi:ACGX-repeat protein
MDFLLEVPMGKLKSLSGWANEVTGFFAKRSAQNYLGSARLAMVAAGSACGAGDDGKKKPEPKPSACGAGDDGKEKPEPKPSACGSGGQ